MSLGYNVGAGLLPTLLVCFLFPALEVGTLFFFDSPLGSLCSLGSLDSFDSLVSLTCLGSLDAFLADLFLFPEVLILLEVMLLVGAFAFVEGLVAVLFVTTFIVLVTLGPLPGLLAVVNVEVLVLCFVAEPAFGLEVVLYDLRFPFFCARNFVGCFLEILSSSSSSSLFSSESP